MKRAKEEKASTSMLMRARSRGRAAFDSEHTQIAFGVLIGINFLFNIAEAEVVPQDGTWQSTVFFVADIFFTSVFGFELIWNLGVHSPTEFWYEPWNLFDFVVVIFSVAFLFLSSIKSLSVLRMLRVFRVVRLIKRVPWLRILFQSILGSIVPVMSAVAILLVVTAMFAIMAVDLYGPRQLDQFGAFDKALFTMYQVGGWVCMGVCARVCACVRAYKSVVPGGISGGAGISSALTQAADPRLAPLIASLSSRRPCDHADWVSPLTLSGA